MPGRRWRTLGIAAGVVVFLGVLLREALSPERFLLRRDAFLLYLPLKQFLASELAAGRIPTWYPFDGLGTSYVGAAIAGLFHPLNVLYLLLEPDQGLKWQTLLCYPAAAIGGLLLARRLGAPRAGQALAAIGYAASGYLLSVSNNTPFLLTAAVLPWTLLAAERAARRPGSSAAGALALALLLALAGGDIQGFLLQGVAATAVLLLARPRRLGARVAALAGAGAVAALAALPLLVPMWFTFQGSVRGAGLGAAVATRWPLHPLRLLELALGPLLPAGRIVQTDAVLDALGGLNGAFWAHSELLGLPVCALALAAVLRPPPRRLRPYLGMAALALVLALGRSGGLYLVLHRVVPFWAAFRYPEKLMPFAALGLALAAGWGTRALARADRRATSLFAAGLVALLVLFALASPARIGALLSPHAPDAAALSELAVTLRGRALLAFGSLAALALLSVKGGRWTGWVAAGLTAAQILGQSGWVVGLGSRREWLGLDSPFRAPVQADLARGDARLCWDLQQADYALPVPLDDEERIFLSTVRTLGPLTAAHWGIGTVRAYGGPGGDAFFTAACAAHLGCPSPCARVGGAALGVVDAAQFDALPPEVREGLEVLRRDEVSRSVLFRDPRARPLASLPRVRHLPAGEAAAAIFDPGRDPARDAVLVGEGPDVPAALGSLQARWATPSRIDGAAELQRAGFAVFAAGCERGWSGSVDDAPVPLERADGSFCAFRVPAGSHRVRLDYRPAGWPWAFTGPPLALLGWGFAAAGARRRTRRAR